jgi:hypothetical protein
MVNIKLYAMLFLQTNLMNNRRHITVNWKGQTYIFESTSRVVNFDGYIKIRFDLNPDPSVNPTGVNVVTIEHDLSGITSAHSERGVDLCRSPVLGALTDWINEYYQLWIALHK